MKLNRRLQKEILAALEEVYPDSLLVAALPGFAHEREYMGNLFYLQEHGLIAGGDIREPGKCRSMIDAQITKDGLDFLSDDGGLQSILSDFSMKLDGNDVIEVIRRGIENAGLDEEMEKQIVEKLTSGINTDAFTEVVMLLIERGAQDGRRLCTVLFESS